MPTSSVLLQVAVLLPGVAAVAALALRSRTAMVTTLSRLSWAISSVASVALAAMLLNGEPAQVSWGTWLAIPQALGPFELRIAAALHADPLTGVSLCLVTLLALAVSLSAQDSHFCGFGSLLLLATLMFIAAANLLWALLFWVLITWAAWALLQNRSSATPGLVQTAGDLAIGLGVLLMWCLFHTLSFYGSDPAGPLAEVYLADGYSFPRSYLAGVSALLLLGILARCGQLPLMSWSQAAHTGPALLALALVCWGTSGIYAAVRFAPLWQAGGGIPLLLGWLAAATAVLAALGALAQTDLRRLCSYLGVAGVGLALLGISTATRIGITAGLWHWVLQAASLTVMFLVLEYRSRQSDGGQSNRLVCHGYRTAAWLGTLSLAALPGLGAFWSLSGILSALRAASSASSMEAAPSVFGLLFYLALLVVFLLALAAGRGLLLLLGGERATTSADDDAHCEVLPRELKFGRLATVLLSGILLLIGPLQLCIAPLLARSTSLANWSVLSSSRAAENSVELDWAAMILTGVLSTAGFGLALLIFWRTSPVSRAVPQLLHGSRLRHAAERGFYYDEILYAMCVWPLRAVALLADFGQRVMDETLLHWLPRLPRWLGNLLRPLQVGLVQFYALAMMMGLLVLLVTLLRW